MPPPRTERVIQPGGYGNRLVRGIFEPLPEPPKEGDMEVLRLELAAYGVPFATIGAFENAIVKEVRK